MIQNMTSYPQLDELLAFLLGKHLPGRSITLTVCHNGQILRHYSTPDIELLALLTRAGMNGWYILYIAEDLPDPDSVACHEFAHLVQMAEGKLTADYAAKRFTWQGRVWPASTKYDDRPWEQEAFSLQARYRKEFNRFKRNSR